TSTRPRGIRAQRRRLEEAKSLLAQGWGMTLPDGADGEAGDAALVPVEVWFDAYAANFLRESQRLHSTQETEELGEGEIAFRVRLPEKALIHFERWVAAWGGHACVRS